jgi:hypothetical protein
VNCIIRPYLLVFVLGSGSMARAQDIRIRLVNARNGKPMTNRCLTIALGSWRAATLLAQTNGEGELVLHTRDRQVTADQPPCNGLAFLGPKVPTNEVGWISVIGDGDTYVVCQEYAHQVPGQPPRLPTDLIPTYPITKILGSGVAAVNTCGKFRVDAKPGELILFARRMSLWEKWKARD